MAGAPPYSSRMHPEDTVGKRNRRDTSGICIVNIYAPSGYEKKREREVFYNGEVATLLPTANTGMILAGDFNCVISNADCTGQGKYSKALENLVRGLDLRDASDATPVRTIFTH